MDRGTLRATVHGVAMCQTRLSTHSRYILHMPLSLDMEKVAFCEESQIEVSERNSGKAEKQHQIAHKQTTDSYRCVKIKLDLGNSVSGS